jgi:asparagine synthase (glutamine-hydrolysing)
MAHGIEIRVPLVDVALLKSLAPVITKLERGVGKTTLARAPSKPLPEALVHRAKTGFGVPTGAWMAAASQPGKSPEGVREAKGLVSRRWSRVVLAGANKPAREVHAL